MVAFASGLSGLNCAMRSSSDRLPSSTQGSAEQQRDGDGQDEKCSAHCSEPECNRRVTGSVYLARPGGVFVGHHDMTVGGETARFLAGAGARWGPNAERVLDPRALLEYTTAGRGSMIVCGFRKWRGLSAGMLTIGAALVIAAPVLAADTSTKQTTFSKDVAPILQVKCQECHQPNSIAPMSLITYQDARPWARSIRERVSTRQMPPWHIDPSVGIQKF